MRREQTEFHILPILTLIFKSREGENSMEDKVSVRLSGIAYESLVNGPGIRRVLFSQGCKHNCKGCFNPDTHSFEGGREFSADYLVEDILKNPMLKGVTFSGGDPLEQADKFAYIAERLKRHGLNVWSYTGYTFEYIVKQAANMKDWQKLLDNIDVLVDGRFECDKSIEGLKFRGSSNQRIVDVKKSLATGKVVTMEY